MNSHPEILCHHEIFHPHAVGVARHLQNSGLLAGTFEGTALEWNAAPGRRIAELGRGHSAPGNACFNEASADADSVAVVSDD